VTPVASPDQTIAVLPLENLSEEKATAYFADGIQGEIVARLTAQHIKAASVQEALHTGKRLVGSVAKDGNRVRITVQLVDAASGLSYWVWASIAPVVATTLLSFRGNMPVRLGPRNP
jgi:TolB-like protein